MAIKAYSRNSEPPMRWHKFLIYVSFVSAVIGTVNLFSSFEGTIEALGIFKEVGANGFLFISVCSLIATAVTQVLKVAGGYHLLKSRWLGVKLLMASWALIVVTSAVCSIAYLSMGDELYSGAVDLMSQAITYAAMLAITVIYYKKRRNFFFPLPASAVIEAKQVFKPSMVDILQSGKSSAEPVGEPKTSQMQTVPQEPSADPVIEASSVDLLMQIQAEAEAEAQTDTKSDVIAYWAQSGKAYHLDSKCTALQKSKTVYCGTIKEARAAGKTAPCSKCGNGN